MGHLRLRSKALLFESGVQGDLRHPVAGDVRGKICWVVGAELIRTVKVGLDGVDELRRSGPAYAVPGTTRLGVSGPLIDAIVCGSVRTS